MLSASQEAILRHLRHHGGQSRGELAEALELRPNTAGDLVSTLLDQRLVREALPDKSRPGRPRIPVRLDPDGRTLVGLALTPGWVHLATINPLGHAVGTQSRAAADSDDAVEVAVRMLGGAIDERTWSVGVVAPGIVDREHQRLTLSGLTHGELLLSPLLEATGSRPAVIDNDMHALAARWWLTQRQVGPEGERQDSHTNREDVLLVRLGDGALGASLLINGKPNRGCVIGGNELGHTRLPVDTPRCYCGHAGCLERIASTVFLHRRGASAVRTLTELCSAWPSGATADDRAVSAMLDLLTIGLGNAINFIRPHRLVLVSELSRYPDFFGAMTQRLKRQMLPGVAERVSLERWDQPLATPGETAAYFALAGLYDAAWLG